ncbi:unnamed protein product [Ectocarpus sp. 12 AP-2014]
MVHAIHCGLQRATPQAAVDEPLLYESWGKNQTYILAFSPTEVVDVTEAYTSDFEVAKARRDVDPETMAALLAEAAETLRQKNHEEVVP